MIHKHWILPGLLLMALSPVAMVHAQTGGQPKYKVLVEQGPAYARVTVTTDPAVAVKQTESFQVVCVTRDYRSPFNIVYRDLEIPQGKSSGTVDIYNLRSPNTWINEDWSIHVERDNNGRYDRRTDLCQVDLDLSAQSYGVTKKILVVSSSISSAKGEQILVGSRPVQNRRVKQQVSGTQPIPNIQQLDDYFSQTGNGTAGTTLLNNYSMFVSYPDAIEGIPLGSLPTDWMGLYNVEIILISLPDLKQACQADPQVRNALRHWLAMGGTLVVNECGDGLARAPQIMPALFGPQTNILPQQMQAEWSVPSKKLKDYISRNYGETLYDQVDVVMGVNSWRTTDQFKDEYWAMAPYLQGHIFAVSDDMSKSTALQWREMLNAHNLLLAIKRHELYQQETVGSRRPPTDRQISRTFQIPTVGDPPVFAFQLLLTLFVILVGPTFFLLFRRVQKLYLLLFATPLLSLVACLGMFLFAILNDGFSRQGRIQTVTFLDQSTGDGVTYARHALYAGTQPSAYLFGDQTLVMDSRRENSPASQFRYRDNQLILTGGELKPRTKHQVVTHEPIETEQRINFIIDQQPLAKVENRMDSEIVLFCAPTKSGWQVARNVPAGQVARCETIDLGQMQREIHSVLDQQSSERERRYLAPYNTNEEVVLSVPAGRAAEQWIKKFKNNSWGQTDIGPGQYIAILKQPLTSHQPDVEVDYKTHELHIVIGKL